MRIRARIGEMVRLPVESDKTRQQVRTAGALAGHFETAAGRRHDGRRHWRQRRHYAANRAESA
jgi:hypothetical protein